MNPSTSGPRTKEDDGKDGQTTEARPQQGAQERNGGDDALAETNPSDSRLDEKVIVNEQSGQKIVNAPSQTEPHPSEGTETVDEFQ